MKAQSGIERYGTTWNNDDPSGIELHCYLHNRTEEQGGLGRAGHFRKIAEHYWGKHNKRKSFIWHPWAERMSNAANSEEETDVHEVRQRRYIGISGCAWSGKSAWAGIYGLVNWKIDPLNTLVLCTSTDIKAARRRIWSQIKGYFKAAESEMPGKLVDSQAVILTTDSNGNTVGDNCGIMIIPGEQKHEAEAIDKIIGAHNKRVILLADELPELSPGLMEAAYSNLAVNPFFQMIGLGNYKSDYDPFGQFVQPKAGWESVNVEDEEWETERGICIHFDGMQSPNLDGPKDIWPIYGRRQLVDHKKDLGENSAGFWRMCRSFRTPIGIDNAIYSEADLMAGKAYEKVKWLTKPVRVSTLDPSFTNGGDRAVQWFGSCGIAVGGIKTLCYDKFVLLREDVRKKLETRDFQIARQFRDNCIQEGVLPKHAALDSTGAGSPFLSIVREEWSPEVLGVDFSGAPSDMTVSVDNSRTAKQAYDRKVSELWYVGKEFLKYGQLKGIIPELAREMKARRYDTTKGVEGLKVKVETKQDMKERLLFSPDMADSAFVMLHLCRVRLGMVPGSGDRGISGSRSKFFELARQTDRVYHTLYANSD